MSDLKPSELTAEERALWDAIMVREQKYIGPDDECPYSKVDWWAEKCILARRRLFAPPASRESDYYCRKCHKVLMVGENHFIAEANQYVCGPWDYSRKSPAKEESNMGTGEFVTDERGAWEKCSRPDCDLRVISRGKAVCSYGCHEPTSEEKVTCECGKFECWECRNRPAQPEPAPTEMPEAVHEAANFLQQEASYEFAQPCRTDGEKMMRRFVLYAAADTLETFWRDHIAQVKFDLRTMTAKYDNEKFLRERDHIAQPVTPPLAMSEPLDSLLFSFKHLLIGDAINLSDFVESKERLLDMIAAVRAQATATKVVKMEKVREAMALLGTLLFEYQQHMSFRKERGAIFDAALAELNQAEKGIE